VPFKTAGSVQREKNTPMIMQSEIKTGEKPRFASFVGASAPPSHADAAIAQKTPRPCMDLDAGTLFSSEIIYTYGFSDLDK
jgi:hypothetical protein